jgi:hypothetical protein
MSLSVHVFQDPRGVAMPAGEGSRGGLALPGSVPVPIPVSEAVNVDVIVDVDACRCCRGGGSWS